MRHLSNRGAHATYVPADAPSDAVDHGQASDARTVDAADAVTDARTIAAVDAADAGTLARNVYRRCHLVLRLVLAERLRVRRSKIKTVQGEEHGRRPHRARGLPGDVRHL